MNSAINERMATLSGSAIGPEPTAGAAYRHCAQDSQEQDKPIERLLQRNPKLWRGCELAGQGRHGYSTGFPELDDILPGRGWPRSGLVEVVTRHWGMGELQLLMPLMRSMIAQGKWILWVAPPYQLYAPALVQAGIDTRQVLIVKADTSCRDALWSMEKALQTQNCGLVLAWQNWLPGRVLRRLQLAGETGETLGVLFKHNDSKYSPSPMRMQIKDSPDNNGEFSEAEVTLLKARGNFRPFTTRLNLYHHQTTD
ncbi:MAG: translesion DNA synthesis-associated protein ImuA [Pseudomonadales bacterium]|nr:translesion DNA synthesis-associated protein ImuA [Pseudomonadales bacterium]